MFKLNRSGRAYAILRSARNSLMRAKHRTSAIGGSSYINWSAKVSRDIVLGNYVFIGPECWIGPQTVIGSYTMLAPRVAIVGDDHNWDVPGTPMQFAGRPPQKQTVIEDDVWVGYGTTILRGVRLGRGSIIAANSTVTKDVPPYEVWAGAPARKLRDRFNREEREFHSNALDTMAFDVRFAPPQVP